MKKWIQSLSFRDKLLMILLGNTLLLSSFSLFFVYSVEEMKEVSSRIGHEDIPEMTWISHWKEDLSVKRHVVDQFLTGTTEASFIESYKKESHSHTEMGLIGEREVPLPASLESLGREIERLDFIVENNVYGLIINESYIEARSYLQEFYLPKAMELTQQLQEKEQETLLLLSNRSVRFAEIIETALVILFFVTALALILSIYAAHRLARQLTEPLEEMQYSTNVIARGEYGLVMTEPAQKELQQMSQSINRMSQRLKESFETIVAEKAYHEQLVNSLPIGIITTSRDGTTIQLNTYAKTVLKTTNAAIQQKSAHLVAENAAFWSLFYYEKPCQNERVPFQHQEGVKQFLVSQTTLINKHREETGRIFYFIDFTAVHELEEKMRQSEKLAAVGELAAGAAHEIRNPLAIIKGFLELMAASLTEDQKQEHHMPLLLKELNRINEIIENMLLMSRPEAPILRNISFAELLRDIEPLFSSVTSSGISLHIDVDPCPVPADPNQMKQVLHNLIRNGIEAMGEQGDLFISSKIEGKNYCLYVTDSGPGIPADVQHSLFDPFFTTKESGTGLGLPLVQRMIESHDGVIRLYETSERGTTFKICLPL